LKNAGLFLHFCTGYGVNQHRNYTPFHVIQNSAKMIPGSIQGEYIPIKSRIQHLFFASCLFHFASVKLH